MGELPLRISKSAAKFCLLMRLAEAGDAVNNGSTVRSADRKMMELSVITLIGRPAEQIKGYKALLFNLLMPIASIEPSADPIQCCWPAPVLTLSITVKVRNKSCSDIECELFGRRADQLCQL